MTEPAGPADAERALLLGLRAGDEAALARLMQENGGRLLTVCRLMLGSGGEAEEAVQEVFVAAWRGAAKFRGEAKLSTWLYRISVNVCLARRRRMGRLRRALDGLAKFFTAAERSGGRGGLVNPPPAPDRSVEAGQAAARVESALASVPAAYRAALVLRERGGLTYEEIAAATGVGVGTVKSRLRRGRLALAEAVRQQRPRP